MKKRYAIFILLLSLSVLSIAYFNNPSTFFVREAPNYRVDLDAPLAVENEEKEKENPQDRLAFERLQLANPVNGKIPTLIREREILFANETLKKEQDLLSIQRSASGVTAQNNIAIPFKSMGPYNVGGRTRALGIDAANENIILAAGISGGVWKTTNQGSSWVRTTGLQEHPAVSTLIQDRRSGKTNEWYYGTGENIGNSADANGAFYYGNGIYKSTDNGSNWDLIAATAVAGKSGTDVVLVNDTFTTIDELAIDQSNVQGTEIYAAGGGKIIRSTDGFNSYAIVLGQNNTGSTVCDVVVTTNGIVYASIANVGEGIVQKGIFKSNDGVSWSDITPNDLDATFPRVELAIDPSDENIVYAITDDQLLVLNAQNDTWENRTSNLGVSTDPGEGYNAQDGYNIVGAIHPDNSDLVFIGGTNLLRSGDAFKTSNSISHIGGYLSDGGNDQSFPSYPNHHPDLHEISFFASDPNKMLTGSDGGVHLTRNNIATSNANNPVTWESLNNGYLTAQFNHAAIQEYYLGDNQIVGGMQDNGTWIVFSNDGESDWAELVGGDGAMSAISYNALYASAQDAFMLRAEVVDGRYQNFNRISPSSDTDEFLQVNPYIVNPVNQDQIFVGANGKLYATNDIRSNPTEGEWITIEGEGTSTQINGFVSAFDMSIEPEGVLYFGTTTGRLYKLSNTRDVTAFTAITQLSRSGLPDGYISSIAVDPNDGSKLLMSFSNYEVQSIWYSQDGGNSWTSVSGNLEENSNGSGAGPSVRDLNILPDGFGGYYYFAATSVGLFMTTSLNGNNTTWQQQASDIIGNVVVASIEVRPIDGTVLAATHGNGVFKANYNVGINPNINFSFNEPATTAQLRGNLSFVIGKGIAYQWIRDGQVIVGANTSEYTASVPGDYKLRIAVQGVNGVGESNVISIDFDSENPVANSILRLNPTQESTSAQSVQFRVSFSEPVINVGIEDFQLSGDVTASIASIAANGGGVSYDVTVSSIGGTGTLGLDLSSNTDITDVRGNPLTGAVQTKQTYNIQDNIAPTAVISRRNPIGQVTGESEVTFSILFSEAVRNVDLSDFVFSQGSPNATLGKLTEIGAGDYELVVSNILSSGMLGIGFSADQNITDNGGNQFIGSATASETYILNIDNDAPTAVISRLDPISQVTDRNQVKFLVLFSEEVENVGLSDFTLVSGSTIATLGEINETATGRYELLVTNIGPNGTLGIDFSGSQDIEDRAGNFFDGNAIAKETYIIETDVIAPTASISRLNPLDENTDRNEVTFLVLFSEEVKNVGLSDFVFTTDSPTAVFSEITRTDIGRYQLSVNDIGGNGVLGVDFSSAQDIEDNAGNVFGGSATAKETYTIEADVVAPTATIARFSPLTQSTDDQEVTFLISFSEAVDNVDLADFEFTSGAPSANLNQVTEVERGSYHLVVNNITENGTLGINFKSAQNIQDKSGNAFDGNASSNESYTIETDVVSPTAIIARLEPLSQTTDRDQVTFSILFSEEVVNVDVSDFIIASSSPVSTLGVLSKVDAGSYTLKVSNIIENGTLELNFSDNQNIEDDAGNAFGGTPTAQESYIIETDITAPTAVIARKNPASQTTDQNQVTFYILFSEEVRNVSISDFTFSSGSPAASFSQLTEVTTGGYELVVSNISGNGSLGVDFSSTQDIEDQFGNQFSGTALAKETYTIESDIEAPTAVISRLDPLSETTDRDRVTFLVLFSEAVVNVDLSDFTLSSGSISATLNAITEIDRGRYELLVTNIDNNGILGVEFSNSQNIEDNGGNAFDGNATAKESYTIETDITAPTVVVSRLNPTSETTNVTSVIFQVIFSEAVRNLDLADFQLLNSSPSATLSALTEIGTGEYELTLTNISGTGTLGISFNSSQNVEDASGNRFGGSIASNETYTIVAGNDDVTGPSVIITRLNPSSEVTNQSQVVFQVLFTESVKNVDLTDFVLQLGAPTSTLQSVTGIGLGRYELLITNISSNGILGIDFSSTQDIEDDAGNSFDGIIASNQTYTIASGNDVVAPTAIITRRNPSDQFTDQTRVTFQVIFSEAVQNVDLADFVLASGSPDATLDGVTTPGAGVYEVTITDISDNGTLGIDFKRDQNIQDLAGNRFGGNAIAKESYTIQNLVTSIDDQLLNSVQSIIVDANPSQGLFNLAFPTYFLGDFDLRVVDATGKQMVFKAVESYVSGDQVALDLSAYPDGLYILNASNGVRTASIKLLKKSK